MRRALPLLLLVGCGSDPSPDPDSGVPSEKAKALCSAIEKFVTENDLPGAVAATRFPDGSTHSCAAGWASIEDKTELRPSDRFRIGSVTKTFVATTVLLLAEDGKLSLDDPLSLWVPGFDASDPTLGQLLNHTSGLGEYLYDDALTASLDQPHETTELLAIARSKPIDRAPGERFEYSNTNYLVAGAVIEAATGRPWFELVRERLLDSLDLSNTFVFGFESTPPDLVRGYAPNGATPIDVTAAMHPTVANAAGCFVSNAPDLLRWAGALYGGDVLSTASLRAMTHDYRVPHAHDGGVYEGDFIGLANFIETNESFGEGYGHAGGLPGFESNMRYLVDSERVLVVLVNLHHDDPGEGLIKALTTEAWTALLL